MAMTVKEFAALAKQGKGDGIGGASGTLGSTCAYCGKKLRELGTGNRPTARGSACSDCYFKEMGKWIANHAVHAPEQQDG